MIIIQDVNSREQSTVMKLVQQLLIELSDDSSSTDLDLEKIDKERQQNTDRLCSFLAKTEAGEAVGVVTVVETFSIYANGNYGVMNEFYVAPDYRSKGVGKMLIDAVKELAQEKSWARVDVTAPPEEKWRRTVQFYESNGFIFTGPKLKFKF